MYLLNAWYVAGFSDEVDGTRLLARRLLDRPIVFFRKPTVAWRPSMTGFRTDSRQAVSQARRASPATPW
jgi:hypothetical protein